MIERNPFFEVSRTPAFTELNGERVSVNRDALINTETGNVLGLVARNYKVTTNEEVANVFSEAFSDKPIAFTRDHLDGSTARWQRDIVLDGDEYTRVIGVDDIIKTRVSSWNAYTGTNALGFNLSAWRQVCHNGMMGWKRMFGMNLPHVTVDSVGRVREGFNRAFEGFSNNFRVWEEWNRQTMNQEQFNEFVRARIKSEDNSEGFLTERQADEILGLYAPIMNRFNENETRWGAYNVITAIATHHTNARQGSNIFSAGHARMERLARDFFDDSLFII